MKTSSLVQVNNVGSAIQSDLLFLSLDWFRPKDLRTPLSTASIEAYFNKNQQGNINAEFKNVNLNSPTFDGCNVRKLIGQHNPRFLALGSYIWNEQYVPGLVSWTKEHFPETIIILGGPQVTYGNHNLALEYPGVDYFIRGEGEEPCTELINVLSRHNVPTQELLNRYAMYTPETLKQGECDGIFTIDPDILVSPYLSKTLAIGNNQPFVRWETLRRCR